MIMLDLLKDKRVIFPKGRQRAFLIKLLERLDLSWSELARRIKVHQRTLNDWKKEKYSMPLENKKDIVEYFQLVGTNNLKHKRRFKHIIGRVG